MKSFRDSIAWQRAMDLSTTIYAATSTFPKEEMFGLTNQLRRASVSVASNIAEGQGRLTSGEFMHFLGMARGSALEVQTQLELAQRLELGIPSKLEAAQIQATEVVRILNAVLSNLRNRPARNRTAPN
ncbi:MAG TPA: four helix bundle protein [Acidobacteriaceae bacterium]|nr:four helix bundle protein [Acidobacteriaceae bacterium]